ncbi:MAG TPA: pilus assembly protein PilM, partial [Acidimicrobiales bacterium]|nr:pilus assembly protein PilM [Acidimicrobiales bacterium]
ARVQLLLAAAQQSTLDVHLEACRMGGLRVVRVDPMPLALVRALGRPGVEVLAGHPTTEAIVCVGAGVTTIVVHEAGIPRFARMVAEGAGAATNAVAAELGVDVDTAEDLKRRAGTTDGADPRADVAVSRSVARLVDEIDNSIRFHLGQPGSSRVERILLTGSGSRLNGLATRLEATTGIPLEPARVDEIVAVEAGMSDAELDRARPNLPTVVGLALGALVPVEGRRINLLPVEVSRTREDRLQIAAAGAAVAVVAGILVAVWALRGHQVTTERQTLASDESQISSLNQQLAQLAPVRTLQATIAQKQAQVRAALNGDIAWTTLLDQISAVLPSDVWLVQFTGTANGGPPKITVSGKGLSQTSTAGWIERISGLPSITGLWVPNSASGGPGQPVTFSSNANLTQAASSNRASQYTGSP